MGQLPFFERFLSTKQWSIRLITYSASHKHSSPRKSDHTVGDKDDFLVCKTKDLVKVRVHADVFYSITDPEKCIQTLSTDELEVLVWETAVATLTNIICSTALNQIATSQTIMASSGQAIVAAVQNDFDDTGDCNALSNEYDDDNDSVAADNVAVSYFFDRAHDEFMSKLHEDFINRYGVDIANIQMESFKIMDTELASEIAQNCLTTAHVENELSNLQGQSAIATQKEHTEAACAKIKAVAEAKRLQTLCVTKNKQKLDTAQADADAVLLKAKAEAEAICLKAAAEAERAKLLSKTELGGQQSLFKIYTEMVKDSNKGVQKVVYMDPWLANSPFSIKSLDGLNRDLHSLTSLGIAASNGHGSKKGKE